MVDAESRRALASLSECQWESQERLWSRTVPQDVCACCGRLWLMRRERSASAAVTASRVVAHRFSAQQWPLRRAVGTRRGRAASAVRSRGLPLHPVAVLTTACEILCGICKVQKACENEAIQCTIIDRTTRKEPGQRTTERPTRNKGC